MLRLLVLAALVAGMGGLAQGRAQDDRGRPIILLVHGRGMLDRDTSATRKLWLEGLTDGAKALVGEALVDARDVRVAWYADVLDPRSAAGCDYAPSDPRSRRDAEEDPGVKAVVATAGAILGFLNSIASDSETTSQLRELSADASFLSDVRKRCASEDRLAKAIDQARAAGRPVIIVAHSLGSLVAYDYLSALRDSGVVQELVTIGSPLGSADLRHLLIGGDSTDTLTMPRSVRTWINVRNDQDPLAVPVAIVRNVVNPTAADDPDPHEMVGYLRERPTARIVLGAWCGAFGTPAPSACARVNAAESP